MQAPVQFKARLVHAEPGQRVVQVSAWSQGQCLGSALGEALSAEAAEERALERLKARLELGQATPTKPSTVERAPLVRHGAPMAESVQPAAAPQQPAEAVGAEVQAQVAAATAQAVVTQPQLSLPPIPAAAAEAEPAPDPDDWSEELAELDLQLQRLGWAREQEAVYLERAFGHPSRSRLTAYGDLKAYLQALRPLAQGADPATAAVPLRRADLLGQSDQLLQSLRWDAPRGRGFLEKHFQLSSRQQLSDEQLLHFNMLLEGELIGAAQLG